MGIIWKAMPLLSTLAALVIIVHSAEEEFESDYRELRPRRLEIATPSYEQPWRMLETESAAAQSTQADWDDSHQDEPSRRRRPVRKRRRRPLPTSEEDFIPQEWQAFQEEYRPYQQEKFNPQSGIIRRRRKQFDSRQPERPNTWTDETVDADRPLIRKRGRKRKRPLVEETFPEISEFNVFTPNDNRGQNNDQSDIQPTETINYEDNSNYDNTGEVHLQSDDSVIKLGEERNRNMHNINEATYNDDDPYTEANNLGHKTDTKEDKSLSEFSMEIQSPSEDLKSTQEKLNDKTAHFHNDVDLVKNNKAMDPQTLKEILKRSNGRSLSEILQQHNLSLVDLLRGKEKAFSVLQIEDTHQREPEHLKVQSTMSQIKNANKVVIDENKKIENRNIEPKPKESIRDTVIIKNAASTENTKVTESTTDYLTTKRSQFSETAKTNKVNEAPMLLSNFNAMVEIPETTTKSLVRRRFPVGIRRKIRMRPTNNATYKSQLSRDLIALTSRRYQLSRNASRSREWKDVMPTMVKIDRKEEQSTNNEKELIYDVTTMTSIPEETTISQLFEESKTFTSQDFLQSESSSANIHTDTFTESIETITTFDITVNENIPTTTSSTSNCTTTNTTPITTTTTTTTTEKPTDKPVLRPVLKASDLRRQAFNNRLKRKRLKQKTTIAPAQEYAMQNIFGMANLVSASEFIAKIQPRTTNSDDEQDFTTLEDFMTTESSIKALPKSKSPKIAKSKYLTTHPTFLMQDTEDTAKIEIEEILNDTRTSARLSKILMERNMTINELVEHRERGSSHIHLADIFHNASREPNPPEPFLSKSLIEPISKETYPLRALLEANLHDPTAKATTMDPNSTQTQYLNIPVVMDFGNNVNENGENMGIMSLFNNFTKNVKMDTSIKKLSKEQGIETKSVIPDDSNHIYGTSRESRMLNTDKDLATWKEIIAMMHRDQQNTTHEVVEVTTREISPSQTIKKIVLDDDLDGDDDLILINNAQHLQDFDNQESSTSDERLDEMQMQEKIELPQVHGVLNKTSNSAKSVTVATASIIGLAMVLFLLTYVAFRWKQQRSFFQDKQNMRADRIPSPVFETRKGHKNNSSTRSKSPMISSSNIYTVDTLDSRHSIDSPEYMWDSLRKPFQ